MAEIWITRAECCQLLGWSKRHFNRVASADGWHHRESSAEARNGKPQREYPLSALPAPAQLKYASAQNAIVPAKSNVLPLFAVKEASSSPVVALPEAEKTIAYERLEAIQPLLDFRKRPNAIALSGCGSVDTLDALAQWIASQQKPAVSLRTIYRWLDRFDKGGLAALGDRPRKDKDQSRFFMDHPLAAAFVQQKYLNEGLSMQLSFEALRRDWLKVDGSGNPPSYSTCANFLNKLPEPLRIRAREGTDAYHSKCSLRVQRAPVSPMDWWVSDHRQFDVMVRNTLFDELQADEPFRVWFTAIMDWGSRKVVGWCFAPTPSSRTINSALRIAALSYGFPKNFYWDNGEDYKKVRRDIEAITLSDEAGTVLCREGVQVNVTTALPYSARSKPIEPHFTHWSKRFDVLWKPSYLGNRPSNRPEFARQAEALHQRYLKGKRSNSPLPTDAEFIFAAVQAIEEFNAKAHRGIQHRTPNEAMEEAYPERNRAKVDARALDILFCERAKRTVQPGGNVQLDRLIYEPDECGLVPMDNRKGQEVMVLRDPYNLGEATAVEPQTLEFIAGLRVQELAGQTTGGRITRDQIKAAMRKQRAHARGYSEYLAALGVLAGHHGWRTEREELVSRALANTGTDSRMPAAAAIPGSRRAALPAKAGRTLQPAFISDAVAQDADIFREIRTED